MKDILMALGLLMFTALVLPFILLISLPFLVARLFGIKMNSYHI